MELSLLRDGAVQCKTSPFSKLALTFSVETLALTKTNDTTPQKNEYKNFGREALLSETQHDNIFREVKIQNLLRYLQEKKNYNYFTLQ